VSEKYFDGANQFLLLCKTEMVKCAQTQKAGRVRRVAGDVTPTPAASIRRHRRRSGAATMAGKNKQTITTSKSAQAKPGKPAPKPGKPKSR